MFQSGFWDVGSKARWSPGHANFPQGKGTPLEIQWSASGPPIVTTSAKMSPVWALSSFHQFTGGAEERNLASIVGRKQENHMNFDRLGWEMGRMGCVMLAQEE